MNERTIKAAYFRQIHRKIILPAVFGGLILIVGVFGVPSGGHREHSDGELTSGFGRIGYDMTDHWHLSYFGLLSDNFANDPGAKGDRLTEQLTKNHTDRLEKR